MQVNWAYVDLVVVPINYNKNHWTVAVLDFPQKHLVYYDSFLPQKHLQVSVM